MRDRLAGIDGCRAGWVAVATDPTGAHRPQMAVFARFESILAGLDDPAIAAVDMPIGLPERAGAGGRGPETVVRPLLGQRQSSVFSVPSRPAVMQETYEAACRVALATSDPPRKVSRQCFNLFPKIREIDALMSPALERRIYECHPELAFWRLNGRRPMDLPKKVRSQVSPSGLDERRALLLRSGYDAAFLDQPLPTGVGRDDLLDAAVLALIAGRIARGEAESFPADPARDAKGLRMAIWA